MPFLITAGLNPEAYRLQRVLNADNIIFSDQVTMPAIAGRENLVLPNSNSPSYAHEALKACLDYNVTKFYPLKGAEIIELAKSRQLFIEYGIELIIPSDDWLKNNALVRTLNSGNIFVMENGIVTHGDLPGGFEVLPDGENGIFCWATRDNKTEYSIYIIEDAGI